MAMTMFTTSSVLLAARPARASRSTRVATRATMGDLPLITIRTGGTLGTVVYDGNTSNLKNYLKINGEVQ